MGNGIYSICGEPSQNKTSGDSEWKSNDDKNMEKKSAETIQNAYRIQKSRKCVISKVKQVEEQFDYTLPSFGEFISDSEMQQYTNEKVREIEANLPKLNFSKAEMEKFRNIFEKSCVKFNNGTIYKGQWNSNFRQHGYGEFIKQEGSKYTGTWRDGIISGRGRYIEKKGNYYEGKHIIYKFF